MKRRYGWTLGLVAVFALTGCAPTPAGIDGRLVDDWPQPNQPELPVPVAGACLTTNQGFAESIGAASLFAGSGNSCDGPHPLEVVRVGRFTGDAAQRPTPPTEPLSALAPAWNDCDTAAKEYLGDDWRTGRVQLRVVPPKGEHWALGARWYACLLVRVRSERGVVVDHTGSMKDGLRGARPLAIGCANRVTRPDPVGDVGDDFDDVPCDRPHQYEFAGVVTTTTAEYPDSSDKRLAAFANACLNTVSRYVNMTRTEFGRHGQFDGSLWVVGRTRWQLGDKSASCYVSTSKQISISVRGYGNRRLP